MEVLLYLYRINDYTMKTKITAFVLLCMVITGLSAQDFKLSWGTEQKAGSSDAVYIPLGFSGGNYYTIKLDNGDGTLMKVDENENLVSQTEMLSAGKKFEVELALIHNNMIIVMNSDFDSGDKLTTVVASTYSLDGKPAGAKLKKIASFKVEKNTEHSDLRYYFSADSGKVAILMDHDMPNKENAKVSISVVNISDLSEIWHTTTSIDYADADFAALSGAVDAAGNFLMLAVIKGGEGKRLQQYSTRMFTFDANDQKFADRELKIEGKYISSAFIEFSTDDKLMITGFYNDLKDNGKNEGIEGAFMCTTDVKTLDGLDLRVKQMDAITKAAIAPSGGWAKFVGSDELNAYFIRNINLDADGGGFVIAEQRYMVEGDNGNYRTRTYYFNHMIIYHFNKSQEIDWISTVPKAQSTTIMTPKIGIGPVTFWFFTPSQVLTAYKYNSFTAVKKDGVIHILYNDHRDNGDARTFRDVKPMINKNKANAVIVSVNAEGKWEKEAIFIGKDVDVILDTSSSFPIPGKGFLISGERGKNIQFGKIDL